MIEPLFTTPTPAPGLADSEYYRISALSYSLCKMVGKPRNAWHYYHNGKNDTGKVSLGNAIHHRMLGTGTLVAANRNTKEGKEAARIAASEGKIVVTESEYAATEGVHRMLSTSPLWAEITAHGPVFEQAWFAEWQHPNGKTWKVKCKPDIAFAKGRFILDLKTVEDSSAEGLRREIVYRGLDLQAAMYMHITGAERYFVLGVETTGQHDANVAVACSRTPTGPGGADYSMAYQRWLDASAKLPVLLAQASDLVSLPEPPKLSLSTCLIL